MNENVVAAISPRKPKPEAFSQRYRIREHPTFNIER
jgi:hypothetical protein